VYRRLIRPPVRKRLDKELVSGQGLLSTMWKGCWVIVYFELFKGAVGGWAGSCVVYSVSCCQ